MAFTKLTINSLPLSGHTVLLRADFNVPLTDKGRIADDYRIRSSLPTIKKLLADGCKVVIISHLGRPDGKKDPAFTLEPAAERLASLLGQPVRFVDECVGPKVKMAIKRAPKKSVIVLENLRFHAEEEANDAGFAKQLAADSGADYFVQDGFGVVHRAHASTAAITQYLPSVAGLLLEREVDTITQAMKHPEKPLVAILGGAKVSDKIKVIEALEHSADTIIIGGAMANTLLAYGGHPVGKSKVEQGQDEIIKDIYTGAARKAGEGRVDDYLVLPTDLGIGRSVSPHATRTEASIDHIPADGLALDIGPASVKRMHDIIADAKTVIWNGPLGLFEIPAFATGSNALAAQLADASHITTIIGGGDTAEFAIHWERAHKKSLGHISTGGGASLELMSGLTLPGVESLLDAR
ncbi:MAG TPA: phosphoglycerate kinase [Candidatus Saccharimonas sp.]|jgi:phosphoglycerate kinase|nr:phosphoglycerate kinase [Candidatus Saccharimonas sp.]